MPKQKTIKNEFSVSGVGLHTGCDVNLKFLPAEEDAGINFVRTDLKDKPVIAAHLSCIVPDSQGLRCTSIGNAQVVVHTVEHLMGALCGLGINNLTIEIDSQEVPGLDGSGIDFINKINEVGIVEQNKEAHRYTIKEPIGVWEGQSSIYIIPSDEFRISYTLDYEDPSLGSQFYSSVIDQKSFVDDIAPCRTFCLEEEVERLKSKGLGKGANYENTLVVGEKGVIDNKVRFDDEFARHKVLDFVGDLYLLGMPICGHVFAVRSGHKLNIQLLKKIEKQRQEYSKKGTIVDYDLGDKKEIDIQGIMQVLPHRYPFLLVDRVVEIEKGKKAVGIKNVTINDGFFRGHFPSRPVMPGVMMVEAMAQTAGVIGLTKEGQTGKIPFFVGVNNVRFRKVVSPGDQLIMEVEITKDSGRLAQAHGDAKVNGKIVAQADMMFTYADASSLV